MLPSSFYEAGLQGIMVLVCEVLNTTTMIPCRRVSHCENRAVTFHSDKSIFPAKFCYKPHDTHTTLAGRIQKRDAY